MLLLLFWPGLSASLTAAAAGGLLLPMTASLEVLLLSVAAYWSAGACAVAADCALNSASGAVCAAAGSAAEIWPLYPGAPDGCTTSAACVAEEVDVVKLEQYVSSGHSNKETQNYSGDCVQSAYFFTPPLCVWATQILSRLTW